MPRHGYVRKTLHKKAPRTAFKPGDTRINRRGRKKGIPNKITVDLKQALINALDKVGGERWFVNLARKNRRSFATLIGKLLPHRIAGENSSAVEVELLQKAQLKLADLSEAELDSLQKIFQKIGLTPGDTPS